jgi:cephalosporin-C deacetylase
VLSDLTLDELRAYRPEVAEPADFDEFWAGELTAARAEGDEPSFEPVDGPVRHAEVFDVTFPGYGGEPVRGWLLVPRELGGDAAVIVEFIGYGGGRGHPLDWLGWSCAGHPHLIMDTRGQGSAWRSSDTPDLSDGGAPAAPGFMTRGIGDPRGYYYTRLFIDAARATDAARRHPATAGRPLVTTGRSQGGGLSIAAAHLGTDIAAALPDVPFLAHPRRAADITDANPYAELARYCRVHGDRTEQVFATLSYIDVVNHAKRASAPALFSVGLTDDITPPSTIFTALHHYAGPADIAVYPYSGHEGGETRHFLAQLAFLASLGLSG